MGLIVIWAAHPRTWGKGSIASASIDFRGTVEAIAESQGRVLSTKVVEIIPVPIDQVEVPVIDGEDDRDLDESTGEVSFAYVDAMGEAMRNGAPFDPILVGLDAGPKRFGYPWDGRHRLNAAVRIGLKIVPGILFEEVTR